MVRIFVGTSGFAYPAWKGRFYPPKLPADEMLHYYAGRFSTVEINSTFYRFPRAEMLAKWADQVPPNFSFAVKCPAAITHRAHSGCAVEAGARLFKHEDEAKGPQFAERFMETISPTARSA